MSKFRIISISNSKRNPYFDKTGEYIIWIKKYLNIEVIDLNISTSNNDDSYFNSSINLFKKYFGANSNKYLLDALGDNYSSEEFSKIIINKSLIYGKDTDFYIAGAYGLREEDKLLFTNKISLSSLTLPHDMAKLILVEQIWRSCTIIKNIKYNY
jgi:23S rRNA (pseudouridine1915-N3)-methyltransferase